MYDVISIGSGLVDAFVYTGVKEKNGKVCFPSGYKILIEKIEFAVGGGGINSASCMSHLGLKTGVLTKIGSGYNARIILSELKKHKVDFLGVQAKEHTGYSIVLETNKKNRTVLTFKGASDNLRFSEIKFNKIKSKWFYFTSMRGESFKSQERLAEHAFGHGIKIAFNPSTYQTKQGERPLRNILKRTDVLSLNKDEAGMLVKKGDLFKGLYRLGPKIVCITNGAKEGGVYDGKFLYRYFPREVYVNEATGAGDVFGSSFLTGLIKLKDIEKAIKIAMANAESVIVTREAKKGLLSWKEVMNVIKKDKFKIKKEVL